MNGGGAAPHPARYALLILPFGVSAGFLTVTMAWLLHAAGIAATDIATLIALSYLPHTWKFFWAPAVDLLWRRKRWYLVGCSGCALGTWATGALPATAASLPWMSASVLATNVAATLLGMAVESLMAHATPEAQKGRVAGWFQAGNLGGLGVGGGAGLWLVQETGWSAAAAALALAAVCGLSALALRGLPEPAALQPEASAGAWGARLREAAADLWAVARSRRGALAILVCFLPVGTGAASNLWSIVAEDWQASAATVALVSGTLGGVISAAGCLAGGFIADRMDRQRAYCVYGLMMVAVALAMAFTPRREPAFVIFASAYAFVQGLTYAGFSAVVLEAIGRGAAATKYNLLASLANMPIAWVTLVDGWVYEHHGPAAFLWADAATGVAGLLIFAGAVAWSRRRARVLSQAA